MFEGTSNQKPHLAVILIDNHKASEIYVNNKIKVFAKVNFQSTLLKFSAAEATQEKIIHLIEKLNNDKHVHGILIQLPLPSHLNAEKILKSIDPKKRCGWLFCSKYWSFSAQ